MYKQSPSRNHRTKGVKVKHILQICLLLAVCFWLLYQIKRSHDKSSEFDTVDGKVVGKVQADNVVQRLGRKDLPRAKELATDVDKRGEDEDEKEVEEEEEEDENKREEDDPEKEDNKHQEEGEGGRSAGDDEIDENDTERADVEPEHEEESVDEDKEREENDGGSDENHIENFENEDARKEGHSESEENKGTGEDEHTEPEENEDFRKEVYNDNNNNASSEEQDHDGGDTNTHEAREEQYKADDASSEVAHEVQTIIPETGNLTAGQAGEIWGKVNFGQGNETLTAEKDDAVIQSGAQPREDMNHTVTSSSSATISVQKKNELDPNNSEDSQVQNSALPSHLNDQPENGTNSTEEQSASLLSNGTHSELPSRLSQNATVEGAIPKEEHTGKSEFPEVGSNRTENVNSNAGEGAIPGEEHNSKSQIAEFSSNKTEDVNSSAGEILNPGNTTSDPSNKKNSTDAIVATEDSSLNAGEKSSNSVTSGSGESSESQFHPSNESSDHIQHDDSVNKPQESLAEAARESRTDSGGLPEIKNEVQSTDDKVVQ